MVREEGGINMEKDACGDSETSGLHDGKEFQNPRQSRKDVCG